MQTAKLIYISIAVLTILPLIAFNIKRLTVKKEGENPRPNIKAIILVSLAGIILGAFIFTHYRFTVNYQPQLVFERFVKSYSSLVSGRINQDRFFEETKSICTPELKGEDDNLKELIQNDLAVIESMTEGKSVRFQLGDIIYPKYYADNEIFTHIEGVKETDRQPIYMLTLVEIDEARKYYVSLLDFDEDGNKWTVNSFSEASQEIVDYAGKYNFMKSEHANKWFKVK